MNYLISNISNIIVETCKTFGGTSVIPFCLFPFQYGGKNHSGCISKEGGDENDWCMTHDKGNWGFCGTDCALLGKIL